jgi:hypothetical protein
MLPFFQNAGSVLSLGFVIREGNCKSSSNGWQRQEFGFHAELTQFAGHNLAGVFPAARDDDACASLMRSFHGSTIKRAVCICS